MKVVDMQLGEDLLGFQDAFRVAMVIEAGIENRLLRIKLRSLFQITDANIVVEDDRATVVAFLAGYNLQERRLTRTVLGDESYLLSLCDGEADVIKQHLRAKRFSKMLYI